MIILTISLVVLRQYSNIPLKTEGFIQSSPFVVKTGDAIYDEFYTVIYDTLHDSLEFEYNKIVELTRPSPSRSVILDVGSGTGRLVDKFTKLGFSAHGIDKSPEMVKLANHSFPTIDVKIGNVLDSMAYEKGVFSHITCMNHTLYHFDPDEKEIFFRNCYHWLLPNGFLIIHLIDPKKVSKRETIEFSDFKYERKCETGHNGNMTIRENFVDHVTQKVRQNELTLFSCSLDDVTKLASRNGFIAHAQINFKNEEGQYVYVFERLL